MLWTVVEEGGLGDKVRGILGGAALVESKATGVVSGWFDVVVGCVVDTGGRDAAV